MVSSSLCFGSVLLIVLMKIKLILLGILCECRCGETNNDYMNVATYAATKVDYRSRYDPALTTHS